MRQSVWEALFLNKSFPTSSSIGDVSSTDGAALLHSSLSLAGGEESSDLVSATALKTLFKLNPIPRACIRTHVSCETHTTMR